MPWCVDRRGHDAVPVVALLVEPGPPDLLSVGDGMTADMIATDDEELGPILALERNRRGVGFLTFQGGIGLADLTPEVLAVRWINAQEEGFPLGLAVVQGVVGRHGIPLEHLDVELSSVQQGRTAVDPHHREAAEILAETSFPQRLPIHSKGCQIPGTEQGNHPLAIRHRRGRRHVVPPLFLVPDPHLAAPQLLAGSAIQRDQREVARLVRGMDEDVVTPDDWCRARRTGKRGGPEDVLAAQFPGQSPGHGGTVERRSTPLRPVFACRRHAGKGEAQSYSDPVGRLHGERCNK